MYSMSQAGTASHIHMLANADTDTGMNQTHVDSLVDWRTPSTMSSRR